MMVTNLRTAILRRMLDANTAEYPIHQFIAPDEARDPGRSDDFEQDAAHNDAMQSKILSAESVDSEDTPSPDNFTQKSHQVHRRMMPRDDDDDGDEYEYGDLEDHAMDANTADYSIHQFIAPGEARAAMTLSGTLHTMTPCDPRSCLQRLPAVRIPHLRTTSSRSHARITAT